jgi:uncharacterized repeat protein (TIGR01451 family)
MNTHLLRRTLATSVLVIGFGLYLASFSSAIAQNQGEPSATLEETQGEATGTPTPTLALPNLEVKKEYKLTSDMNANGSIDAGDKVTYTITFSNVGSTDAANLVIRDNLPVQYFEIIKKEDIAKDGTYNGQFIEWKIDKLAANSSDSVSYTVTIKNLLASGITEISNPVTVLSGGSVLAEAKSIYTVTVLTPSPTPTITLSPTVTQTAEATPTTVSAGASTLSGSPLPTWIVAIMATLAILVFTYVGAVAKFPPGKDADENDHFNLTRISIFREGVIIIFIVSAVLLMGISNILPSDGVISILSAIVGYVFGRATTKG